MTLKIFDELILQVFESSEHIFFPVSTQRQAKAFVKALHVKGLEYNKISDEINESDERFSTWRKGLSCNKVGRSIIQRINQPLWQLLQEVHPDDDDEQFEVFLGIEPNFFSEKLDVRKNSKLWRLLQKPKAHSGSLEKISETSSEDSVKRDISLMNCSLKSIASNSIPTETSEKGSQEHLGMSYGDLISFEEPCEPRADNASPKMMNQCSNTKDMQPDVVKNEDSVLRSPSTVSSTEDQFYDCDSFKSYSSTFMDDSVLSNPQCHSCVQEMSPLRTSINQSSGSSPEKVMETKSPLELESYSSDLDISCYDDVPPQVSEINRLLSALPRNRSQPGFLYVLREKSSNLMFKIGASRNPDKKLRQAAVFNSKLTLFKKCKVTNMDEALTRTYLRLDAWKVDGHLGWFQGGERLLQELENVEI